MSYDPSRIRYQGAKYGFVADNGITFLRMLEVRSKSAVLKAIIQDTVRGLHVYK